MFHFKDKCLSTLVCALVAGLMLMASPVKAGLMNFISSTVATPLNFTTEWEWLFDNNTWATAPTTVQLGAPDWEVTMQGFAAGDLSETSRHLVAPHVGEIAPNVFSSLTYLGAFAGIGPTVSWIDHAAQGHFNVYRLTANVIEPGVYVQIIFEGLHAEVADGIPRSAAASEPSSFLLLGAGLAAFLVSRRRAAPALGGSRTSSEERDSD
jgi:hypothetical protein